MNSLTNAQIQILEGTKTATESGIIREKEKLEAPIIKRHRPHYMNKRRGNQRYEGYFQHRNVHNREELTVNGEVYAQHYRSMSKQRDQFGGVQQSTTIGHSGEGFSVFEM